jgi:hypothetical protein
MAADKLRLFGTARSCELRGTTGINPKEKSADYSALGGSKSHRSTRSAGNFSVSVPVTFEETPGAALGLPTRRYPHGTYPRRHFPVTCHPLVLVVLPGPITGDPDMVARRTWRRHFLLRRRRRLHHHNGAAAGGTGHRRVGGGAGGTRGDLHGGRRGSGVHDWRRCRRRRRWWRSGYDNGCGLGGATGQQANHAAGREHG